MMLYCCLNCSKLPSVLSEGEMQDKNMVNKYLFGLASLPSCCTSYLNKRTLLSNLRNKPGSMYPHKFNTVTKSEVGCKQVWKLCCFGCFLCQLHNTCLKIFQGAEKHQA